MHVGRGTVILTKDRLKLSHGEVQSKPSRFPHTIDDIGPLSRGVSLGDAGAVLHVDVPKADSNAVLRKLDITPQSRIGCAGVQCKNVGG